EAAGADLLGELPAQGFLVALAGLDPAAGGDPERRAAGPRPAHEQRTAVPVEDERADGRPFDHRLAHPFAQLHGPTEALLVRDRRVRRRRRRQDEQAGVDEDARLDPELGPAAERAAEGLLADERDHARPQLARKAVEAGGRSREVAPSKVAGSLRRAVRG